MVSTKEKFRSDWTHFVGRTQHLDVLRRHAEGGSAWRWLHIYGQSGIGKSTLLHRFLSESEDGRCYYIDGSKVVQQKEAILDQVAAQLPESAKSDAPRRESAYVARCLNRHSHSAGGRIVLLIDSFDHWHAIEHWFLQWLDTLDPSIRLVTVGRYTLTGGWLRSDWVASIHTMQLQALTVLEVERYAMQRGITESGDQTKLFRFSRGVPLAMVLAAETMLKGGQSTRFEREENYHLIAVLMQELLHGLPATVHRMLEAASVYWRFNEERLSAVMETELDPESFRQFVLLPFVMMKDDGWILHDAVRAWVLEDLILRKPTAYELMRRHALLQIRQEERTHPQQRSKLQIDKMSLHEHPIVRAICFSGHPDEEIELRQCQARDLPVLRSLYIQFHHSSSPAPEELPLLHDRLQDIWEVDPASFITMWKANELIAFFGKVPLHERMRKILDQEPLLNPFLRGWQPVPNAYLFALVGIKPELQESIRAYLINTLITHFSRSEWILDFTCLKEWFPVFELCGFERAAWADAASAGGTEYRAFVLDLRQEDFLVKLDRSVSRLTSSTPPMAPTTKPDIQELKYVLKHWSVLPRTPAASQAFARLFPQRVRKGESDQATGLAAQQILEHAIRRLAEGDETEELFGRLLASLYLERIRPHERVAKRLNMSLATYYRHLNKALEWLYHELDSGSEIKKKE